MKKTVHKTFTLILISVCILLSKDSLPQSSQNIQVAVAGKDQSSVVPALTDKNIFYISLSDFAGAIGARWYVNSEKRKMVITYQDIQYIFTVSNPFITINKKVYQIPTPVRQFNGKIYIPVQLLAHVANQYQPEQFQYNSDLKKLTIMGQPVNITSISITEKANGTLIQLYTTRTFQKRDVAVFDRRNWFNVTILNGQLDSLKIAGTEPVGIIKRVVPYQFEGSTQISFLVDKAPADSEIDINNDGILLTLWNKKQLTPNLINDHLNNKNKWIIDKIILDPGHGGKDPGAVNKRLRIKEKDINLDVALRLKNLLEKNSNIKVLMTRESDRFVELKERTKFANENQGKLFVSIHTNSMKSRKVRGYSTWFLGEGKTEDALAVAELENSVIELEEDTSYYAAFKDVSHILNAIAQNTYVRESQDMAQIVNNQMGRKTTLNKWGRGVYQARFVVLWRALMPSILVEMGFISNDYEAKQLKKKVFRQKIAEALYNSIMNFKNKYDKQAG